MGKRKLCETCRGNINGSKRQVNLPQDACTCPRILPRNAFALHASRRKAGPMHDRRQERGGRKNKQREYLETD